jgi:hypothetical protein
MKKIFYILIIVVCAVFTSCENDPEIWNSETYDYSGRFVYALYDEDGETEYLSVEDVQGYYEVELQIFNTSANTANEVWIENVNGNAFGLGFKAKLSLTGSSESFFASTEAVNLHSELENNEDDPTALGQTASGVEWYARIKVLDGKILPKAATSIGGNTVDSIYLKIAFLSDEITFVSVEKDRALWANPNVPEYEWKHDPAQNEYDDTSDEIYILKGYRYTGFPEDM